MPKHTSKNISSKSGTKTVNSDQNNIYSILSLVFGLAFFIPFAPILAIIFGFIGLSQIKKSGEEGKGLAIAGIILGFVWLAIWIIVLIIFFIALFAALISVGASVTP